MGVDNSGVLVVGDLVENIDFTKLPGFDFEQQWEEDDIFEAYYWNTDKLVETKLKWRLREPRGYEHSGVFGFCLSSPSYGVSQFDYQDFIDDLNTIRVKWVEWTAREPVVYLMNLQS